MSEHAFDAFTRRAADAVSRRSSLAALGGAALVAGLVTSTTQVRAVKGKKKKKKCQKQLGQCEEAVDEFCDSQTMKAAIESVTAEGNGVQTCESFLSECCGFFTSCNARDGVECLLRRVVALLVAA